MANRIFPLLVRLAFVVLLVNAWPASSVAAQSAKQLPTAGANSKLAQTAQQALMKAHFYYNNDDIKDEAARQYRLVISQYRGTKEAEIAQFYLGSYYHRKYYILKERYAKPDDSALKEAATAYQTYINNFSRAGNHTWLAESYFNLALIYLQRGEARVQDPLNELLKVASLDQTVYLYQVVWSRRPSSVVDYYIPTQALAQYTLALINPAAQSAAPSNFETTVAKLTTWCQSQRSRRAAS